MSDRSSHMQTHPENRDDVVKYDGRLREHYLVVRSDLDHEVRQLIYNCPWCGDRLPSSLRDRWFSELESIGIDPLVDEIPAKYKTSAWYESGARGQADKS